MIATTRIPTHRNDGSRVSRQELHAIIERVQRAFDGYSLDSPSDGVWVASDGQVYREKSQKLEVVVSREEVEKARDFLSPSEDNSASERSILKFVRVERSLISNKGRTEYAEADGQEKRRGLVCSCPSTR